MPKFHSLVGQPAIDFDLLDANHKTQRRLEQYRGSWLILVFHRHLA